MRVVQLTARNAEASIAGLATTEITEVYSTGNVYYVDSNNGSDSNSGLTSANALATVGAAITLCTANKHDIVYLMPNHAETLTAATSIATSGVTILGQGNGANRPTFTLGTSTAAGWDIAASNVSIKNIIFKCDIDNLANVIDVQSSYCSIEDCEFWEGTAKQFVTAIDLTTTAADNCTINRCTIMSATAGAACGIDVSAACDNLTISNCRVMGAFSSAPLWSDAAFTLSTISNNVFYNSATGQFALELTAAATGVCCDNRLYSDAGATCFDPGSMANYNNESCNAIDTGSHELPTTGDDITGVYSDTTIIASDLVIAASDIVIVVSDTTQIASDLLLAYSDTTAIHSDTTAMHTQTTTIASDLAIVASDLLLAYSDTTIIASDLVIVGSDLLLVYSDTTIIASDLLLVYSDTTIIASDVVILVSDTTAMHTQTTTIASDLVLSYSDTTAIHSDTTIIASDVVIVVSDTTQIASDVVLVYSDTTAIHSDTTIVASDVVIVVSDTTQIASDLLLVYSDTTAVHSDTTAMHIQTTTIASDLVVIASDLLQVYSDTTLVVGYVGRAGMPVGKSGVVADNALPNNTQGVVLCTATDGDVLIEKIILSKDSTLLAGPVNVEVSSNNVYGPTGADDPHAALAVAELGASLSVDLASAGVTPLVPFVLESGKILAIHGSNAVGSSAGNIKYAVMGRNMTASAYLA